MTSVMKVTYKALDQLNRSGFDLVKVEALVRKTRHSQNLDSLLVPALSSSPSVVDASPGKSQPSTCSLDSVARDLARKGLTIVMLCIYDYSATPKIQDAPMIMEIFSGWQIRSICYPFDSLIDWLIHNFWFFVVTASVWGWCSSHAHRSVAMLPGVEK